MDCIVVGNGESLKVTPLERLAARYDTFACNRIHLIYPFTSWRPVYYVRFEPPQWNGSSRQFFEECRLHIDLGERCIFPHWEEQLGTHPNVEYLNSCHHYKYHHLSRKFPLEWHLPMLCDVNAVTTMMQIAVLKGYERIFLVGCDVGGAHFSTDDRGAVETERLKIVHAITARCCPIPILNATVGGSLEAYPRVNVEELC